MAETKMEVPHSAIREGERWGRAKKPPTVVDGKRIQIIVLKEGGTKTIYHVVK